MKKLQLANNLIELRHGSKVTQEELANFLGVTKASVSKWENAQSFPDINLLPQLASYFNISIDELLGYEAQMTKAKIKEWYHKLADEFANKPFEEVMTKTNELVKEYYSCYPLLMQMVILWMNHYNLAATEIRQKEILIDIKDLCQRIITESNQGVLSSDGVVLKAMAQLQLGETQAAIDALGEILDPKRLTRQCDGLMTQAYLLNGEPEKAEETVQVSILLNLLSMISNGGQYFSIHMQEYEKAELILFRLEKVMEIFELGKLHPNVSIQIYYQGVLFYCIQNKLEQAILEFIKFEEAVMELLKKDMKLHGDKFFTKLDSYFNQLDLGDKPVRNKKLVVMDLIRLLENPAMGLLVKEESYMRLKTFLKSQRDLENTET